METKNGNKMGVGIALGIALGAAFGVVMDNIAMGVGLGVAIGVAIGAAMNKNLTIQMGNCHHRKYIPMLLPLVQSGTLDPARILTQSTPLGSVIEAYERFDLRDDGWIKVMLNPGA